MTANPAHSEASATSSKSTASSVAIGAGVGVPLGVLLLLSLFLLFYRERKLRLAMEKLMKEKDRVVDERSERGKGHDSHSFILERVPQELYVTQ